MQRKQAKRSTLSPPELLFATGQTLQKAPASTAKLQLGEGPLRGRQRNCNSYLSLHKKKENHIFYMYIKNTCEHTVSEHSKDLLARIFQRGWWGPGFHI